jgi:hypothetical protein
VVGHQAEYIERTTGGRRIGSVAEVIDRDPATVNAKVKQSASA